MSTTTGADTAQPTVTRVYQAASTLGSRYMMPTYFGTDRESAENWLVMQQKVLAGLAGVDTVRIECRDLLSTNWMPLTEATDEGGWRPPARVISGDVEAVTAALDGLPVGSIITCDEAGADFVYHRDASASGSLRWWQSGYSAVDSTHIARHQVPITVLREGTGA